MTDTLEHITLTTGASRHSARSEVSGAAINATRTALATGDGHISDTGWQIELLPIAEGGHAYKLSHSGKPIAVCWLCTDDEHSVAFWRSAISGPKPPGTRIHPPLGVPWLASALLAGALEADRGILMECADLERCVAWMLLE